MENQSEVAVNLAALKSDGFLIIPQALDAATVSHWKEILYGMYGRGEYEIKNGVGNVAFEKLLALQPDLSKQLVGHASVAPYLKTVLGKQCQLRKGFTFKA